MHAAFVIPQTWRDDIHNQRINRYLEHQVKLAAASSRIYPGLNFFFLQIPCLIRYRRSSPEQLFSRAGLAALASCSGV